MSNGPGTNQKNCSWRDRPKLYNGRSALMIQTIDNRVHHQDIKSNIYDPKEYHTLKYPHHDYKLTPEQDQRFQEAWNMQESMENKGKLFWDTTKSSIKSNEWYEITPDPTKTGKHYYFEAAPKKK